jgi:hypothetical protein
MTRNLASDIASMLMAVTLVFSVAVSDLLGGCSGRDNDRANDRVYDPYHNDYHAWNQEEAGNYARWETETRREHRDFNQRNDEQKEYWTWRHDGH